MPPVHESTLPAILGKPELAALLGMSIRTLERAMLRPDWILLPLPGFDRPRWSRDQVLATLAALRGVRRRSA